MQIKFPIAIAIATSLLFTAETIAQDTVIVEATEVKGNIYMITGQGGNIGLFTGVDGSFMIDDQFAPLDREDHRRGQIGGRRRTEVPDQYPLSWRSYRRQ